jgi:hypothetical protein
VAVTVQITSTQWVDSEGSNIPSPAAESGPNKVALGAGLGVGIPAFIALVGVGLWLCLRKRRDTQTPPQGQWQPSQDMAKAPGTTAQLTSPPAAALTLQRKPVATEAGSLVSGTSSPVLEKTELAGGKGVVGEISGREVHPFPIIKPFPPIAVPGNHELHA